MALLSSESSWSRTGRVTGSVDGDVASGASKLTLLLLRRRNLVSLANGNAATGAIPDHGEAADFVSVSLR